MLVSQPSQVILDGVLHGVCGCLSYRVVRPLDIGHTLDGPLNERNDLRHQVGEPHHACRSERFEWVDRRPLAGNGSLRSDISHVVVEDEDLTIHGISEPARAVLDYARRNAHASPPVQLSYIYEPLELVLPLVGAELLAKG